MGDKTGIAWTDSTWNPLRGCSKVSEGCRYCYAMGVAARFSGPGMPYEGLAKMVGGKPQWTNKIMLVPDKLDEPMRWQKPRMIFVNSMSDLFHEQVPDSYIAQVFGVMAASPHHIFQVLTKRPDRMLHWFTSDPRADVIDAGAALAHAKQRANALNAVIRSVWPLPNVWVGTSVENNDVAERVEWLSHVPAAVRFISAEPLIGPLNDVVIEAIQDVDARGWVITGGESGQYHRPFDPQWAEDIRARCAQTGIAYFHKQNGGLTSHSSGDLLNGRQYHEYPRQLATAGV